jgi:hypothetical protein
MRAPLFLLGAAVGLTIAACSDSEEEALDGSTAIVTTATPTGSPPPSVTPAPGVEDWPVYKDPGGLYTLKYPAGWYRRDSSFLSSDPDAWSSMSQPPESLSVAVASYEAVGSSGCGGALSIDPKSGETKPKAGATLTQLGGLAAWEIVRTPGDPLLNDPYTQINGVSVIYKGYCFNIAAYSTQRTPDVSAFTQIVDTFEFTF